MAFSRFTLRQLEAFVTVAELHSFTAAADRLVLTSQAISRLVAELETVLGFRVFERSTRSVRLSGAGREFLPSAESTLRHVRAAENAANDVLNRVAGIVRIGAPQVLAGLILPAAIADFVANKPKVVVRVVDTSVDALIDHLADGDIDLAIGPDRPTPENVSSQKLFNSPWVLWCRPDHPLTETETVDWSDLHDVTLVAAGKDHERSVAQMRSNLPDDIRVSPIDVVSNVSTAMGLAANGLAATLAPAYVRVMADSFGLVMRRVLKPETIRQVCLYRNQRISSQPVTDSFAEHLAQWLPLWHRRSGDGDQAESSPDL